VDHRRRIQPQPEPKLEIHRNWLMEHEISGGLQRSCGLESSNKADRRCRCERESRMAEAITITATYRPLPGQADKALARVADLQKEAAVDGVTMTVSPKAADGITIVYALADHDTLDAMLRTLAPLLEALTATAPLAGLTVDGPMRTDAVASFHKLDAGLAAA